MTKKDFEAIAKIIAENLKPTSSPANFLVGRANFVFALARYFSGQNENFDEKKFIDACTTTNEPETKPKLCNGNNPRNPDTLCNLPNGHKGLHNWIDF